MDGRKERMVQARLSAEQREALDELVSSGAAIDISAAIRGLIPPPLWVQVIREFGAQLGAPGEIVEARPIALLIELAAIGLRPLLCETQPALDPSDQKDLSPRDMAATYLRWRRATEWALACAAAAASGKAAPAGPAWQLFAKGEGNLWELKRTDATPDEFKRWLVASRFDYDALTDLQRESMRATFERARDVDEARGDIGDEP